MALEILAAEESRLKTFQNLSKPILPKNEKAFDTNG